MRAYLCQFYRAEEAVLTVEAEDAEPLRPEDGVVGEPKRFLIRSAEPARCRVTTHESQGISIPLCVLHQRQGGRLGAGEGVRFASIFYNVSGGRAGSYDLAPAGPEQYLVTGDDRALVALDELSEGGIECRGKVIIVEGGRMLLAGGTVLRLSESRWASEELRNVQLDLGSGRLVPHDGAFPMVAEQLVVTDADRAAVQGLLQRDAQTVEVAAPGGGRETTEPLWRCTFPDEAEIRRLQSADLDGDGTLEVLVARGRRVHCLGLNGTILWSHVAEDAVLDVADVEAREAPGREVAAVSADTHLYLLSADGELLESHQPLGPPHSQTFGDRPWPLWVVDGMDIDGDGLDELFTVMGNYKLIALDQDWTRLWQYGQVAHGAMDIEFADWDGDGADEVFVSDRYGFVHGVSQEGQRVFIGYSSIGDVQFDLAPLAEEGLSVIYGSSTGDLLARGPDGKIAWRFDNYGYAVRRIRAADLGGDEAPEVLVASATGYLYALDSAGEELWRDRLGFSVNDVTVADLDGDDHVEVLAAGEDGLVRVYSGDGAVVRTIVTPGPARRLCVAPPGPDGRVLVATAEGGLLAW